MEVNAVTAALPALLGNLLGIGFPILLYKNILKQKYEEEWQFSTHGKIKYWSWLGTFASLFLSLTPTFSELLFVAMNESQIRFETIYRSSLLLVGYNFLVWVIGGFLLLVISDRKNNQIEIQIEKPIRKQKSKFSEYLMWGLMILFIAFLVNYLFNVMDEMNAKKRTAEAERIEKEEENKIIKYALVSCNLVDKNEMIENSQLQEINVNFKKEKITLIKNSSEIIIYESCIFYEEEKICRSWGDKKTTRIKFNPKQNVFTYEVFAENDDAEKESESKLVCITKPSK